MKILIIEDEAPAAKRLQKLITEIHPDCQLEGPLDSIEASVDRLKNDSSPDLILMDIQLSDGLSFEIFEQVSIDVPVIFTTAYDEYALKAFQVNSIDYLLKPIDPEALKKALAKWDKMKVFSQEPQWAEVIENLIPRQFKTRFLFKKGNGYVPVLSSDLAFFHASEKMVVVQTFDGQQFILDETLDHLQAQLDPEHFFRANRSFLIAQQAVKELRNSFNGKLKLLLHEQPAKTEIMISREKAADFKRWLGA